MLVSRNREKLVNTIVFFASHTKYCGKIKLFKLLYLLDFEHFRLTGRSVTGLGYQAWKFGPVPVSVMEEWENPEGDMRKAVEIVHEPVIDYTRQAVKPLRDFDDSYFTPRQLKIMNALAEKYADTYSPKLIDVTHAENGAWSKTWRDGHGDHREIPYDLALSEDTPHVEAIRELARENEALAAAGKYKQ